MRTRLLVSPMFALALTGLGLTGLGLTGLALTGCGGGGGGGAAPPPPPVVVAPQLKLQDAVIAAGSDRTTLRIELAGDRDLPSLLQFDLQINPQINSSGTAGQLQWLAAEVSAPNQVPNLHAELISAEVLRIIIGDATNRDAQAIPVGGLIDIPLAVVSPRIRSDVAVILQGVIASDSKGQEIALASGRPAATITIN